MQTRTRNALVFAAAAAVVVAAVVWVWQKREMARPLPGTLDAIPEGALLVATADLGALRRSGAFAPLLSETREIPGLGKVRDVCGFDPMAGLTELGVAVPASGGDGDFGLVASGAIDPDALLACASKVIEARGGRSVVNPIGAFRTVRDAKQSTSGAEIAVREGGPILLGAGNYLRSMIDAAEGRVPSARADGDHTKLASEVGPGALRVTVVLTPEQRRTLLEEIALSGAQGSPAASVVGLGLSVSIGERVGLSGVVACDAPAPCADLAKIFDGKRAAQADDTLVRLMGLGSILERLRIGSEGSRISARVDMSTDEATELVTRVIALRAAAGRPKSPIEEDRKDPPPPNPKPAPTLGGSAPPSGAVPPNPPSENPAAEPAPPPKPR
ncbi:hypothetical protein KEG38_32355 [Polyangium jinanense]|uniref:hypothetical protein n=1 Tax=Polyangium jinanense TaxID=2829994 RepID=UPI0023408ED1|nr:hypothetical protein [Polyangium jinanense]MDC3958592.1 hypothetical protein [Polyangium jinanense]